MVIKVNKSEYDKILSGEITQITRPASLFYRRHIGKELRIPKKRRLITFRNGREENSPYINVFGNIEFLAGTGRFGRGRFVVHIEEVIWKVLPLSDFLEKERKNSLARAEHISATVKSLKEAYEQAEQADSSNTPYEQGREAYIQARESLAAQQARAEIIEVIQHLDNFYKGK